MLQKLEYFRQVKLPLKSVKSLEITGNSAI